MSIVTSLSTLGDEDRICVCERDTKTRFTCCKLSFLHETYANVNEFHVKMRLYIASNLYYSHTRKKLIMQNLITFST